jgi:hypothetical protein
MHTTDPFHLEDNGSNELLQLIAAVSVHSRDYTTVRPPYSFSLPQLDTWLALNAWFSEISLRTGEYKHGSHVKTDEKVYQINDVRQTSLLVLSRDQR